MSKLLFLDFSLTFATMIQINCPAQVGFYLGSNKQVLVGGSASLELQELVKFQNLARAAAPALGSLVEDGCASMVLAGDVVATGLGLGNVALAAPQTLAGLACWDRDREIVFFFNNGCSRGRGRGGGLGGSDGSRSRSAVDLGAVALDLLGCRCGNLDLVVRGGSGCEFLAGSVGVATNGASRNGEELIKANDSLGAA